MQVVQETGFRRKYKKLHKNQLPEMNDAIEAIINDPYIGTQKSGDLHWLRVYKFKMCGQLVLLGYELTENNELILTFIDFGPHENFYRDLKK